VRKRNLLIALALVLALAYVGIAVVTDASTLNGEIKRLGWLGCESVLLLSIVNYLVRFIRWQGLVDKLGHHLPAKRHLLYYLAGFAFTVSPAKAGETVRSLYLKNHGVGFSESLAAFFVERFLDLFAILILAGFIALDYQPTYRLLTLVIAVVLAVVLFAVCQMDLPKFIIVLAGRCGGPLARSLNMIAKLLRSSRTLLNPRSILFGILLGLIAWGAEGVGFGIICHGLQINGNIWIFIGIYSLSALAGSAAFFLPAGLGGMEVVITALLTEQGATVKTSIIATLLCRLTTLWFAVLIGAAAAAAVGVLDRMTRRALAP